MAKSKSKTVVIRSDKANNRKQAIAKLAVAKTDPTILTAEIEKLLAKAKEQGINPTLAKAIVTLY